MCCLTISSPSFFAVYRFILRKSRDNLHAFFILIKYFVKDKLYETNVETLLGTEVSDLEADADKRGTSIFSFLFFFFEREGHVYVEK